MISKWEVPKVWEAHAVEYVLHAKSLFFRILKINSQLIFHCAIPLRSSASTLYQQIRQT